MLEYGEFKVPLFWCKWVRPRTVSMNKDGVTTVDLNSMGYREEPFVWEKDVVQVFYALDQGNNEEDIYFFKVNGRSSVSTIQLRKKGTDIRTCL